MPNEQVHSPMSLSMEEFQAAIDRAAEAGAKRALNELGLSDKDAANDLRELRSLLTSWKDVRKSAIQAVVKFLVTALLGALLVGLGIKLGASSLLK